MSQVMIITGSVEAELRMLTRIDDLLQADVSVYTRILPVDCTPIDLKRYLDESKADIFMVGSSQATILAGIVAALTDKPVIGVPLNIDTADDAIELLYIEGLPTGTPHATTFAEDTNTAAAIALQLAQKN